MKIIYCVVLQHFIVLNLWHHTHTRTHTHTHTHTLTGLCYYRLSCFLLSSPFPPCFLLFFLFLFSLFSLLLEKRYVCLSVGFLNCFSLLSFPQSLQNMEKSKFFVSQLKLSVSCILFKKSIFLLKWQLLHNLKNTVFSSLCLW